MEKVLFDECQKFSSIWLWVLLSALGIGGIWAVYQQLVLGIPFGQNPAPDIGLLFFAAIPLFLMLLFYITKLETRITETSVDIRFFPFLSRSFDWEEIEKAHVRQYRPLVDFGGWGIRFGFRGKGRAFNIGGNKGLQLVMKDGCKILIGTQQPETLEEALRRAGKWSS